MSLQLESESSGVNDNQSNKDQFNMDVETNEISVDDSKTEENENKENHEQSDEDQIKMDLESNENEKESKDDQNKSTEYSLNYKFKSPTKKVISKKETQNMHPEEKVLNECFITWKYIITRLSPYIYMSYIWTKCIDDTIDFAFENPAIFKSKSVVSKDHIFSGNPFLEFYGGKHCSYFENILLLLHQFVSRPISEIYKNLDSSDQYEDVKTQSIIKFKKLVKKYISEKFYKTRKNNVSTQLIEFLNSLLIFIVYERYSLQYLLNFMILF